MLSKQQCWAWPRQPLCGNHHLITVLHCGVLLHWEWSKTTHSSPQGVEAGDFSDSSQLWELDEDALWGSRDQGPSEAGRVLRSYERTVFRAVGIRMRDGDGAPSFCVAVSKWAHSHTQVNLQEALIWPPSWDLLLSQPWWTEQVACSHSCLQPFTPQGDP